jgi:hypothetical protein
MALVVPNVSGETEMLNYIVGLVDATNKILRLYSLPTDEPTDSTVIGSLTEVTSAGYAPITLLTTSWVVSQSVGVTTASYSEQTFSFSTNAAVYGYYITDTSATPKLLWLEKFSGAPFNIPTGGGTISVSCRLTLA